ncbi:MAG TPA: type II toxin-antitoxin system VapB family antitoxin, partial [Casimicrobiaceae bacterium]
MATNLDLDDKLIEAARRLGRHRTKRDAVTRALEEYVQWLANEKGAGQTRPIAMPKQRFSRSSA